MRPLLVLLAAVIGAALGNSAAAQVIEIPTFDVSTRAFEDRIGDVDVAVGTDGNLLFLWSERPDRFANGSKAVTRLLSPLGMPLGEPARIDQQQRVRELRVSSDTRGAYVAAWEYSGGDRYYLHGRLLAGDGTAAGDELQIDPLDPPLWVLGATVVGLPSGSVFLWLQNSRLWGRLYDGNGTPRGLQFEISDLNGATGFDVDADAIADGGFVVTWNTNSESAHTVARVFRPDGQPRGPVLTVDAVYLSEPRVAVSPTGGFAVSGTRWDGAQQTGLWVRRLTDDGVLLWESLVDQPATGIVDEGDLAFDTLGNVLVAWGRYANDANASPPSTYRPQARGLDAGGTPLGGAIELDDGDYSPRLRVARLENGTSFVATWNYLGFRVRATVIALCGPGSSVCGDGDVDPQCEQCDLGSSNSATAPDACRTNCRRAHCGDGVHDANEQCDDGNVLSCDGCDAICKVEVGHICGDGIVDPTCNEECDDGAANRDEADACRTDCRLPRCRDGIVDVGEQCDDRNATGCDGCSGFCVAETGLVCGDGVMEPGCNESCDDGNLVGQDGCASDCVAERIPGDGKATTDCYAEWSVANAGNVPYLDSHGTINVQQSCTDGDPRCDLDGTAGSCTFAVRVCANNTELASCVPSIRLAAWTLRVPSAAKAAHDPAAAAVRDAFAAVVPGAIVGPSTRDVCSPAAEVPVKLRGAPGAYKLGKLKLKTVADAYDGSQDKDQLKLTCLPAAP